MKTILALLFIVNLSGCGLYNFKPTGETAKVEDVVSDIDSTIQVSLKDASKDECVALYKLFAGVSMYVERTKKFSTTIDVFKLFSDVKEDYGWKTEKYKDLTDAVEKDLSSKGFTQPTELTDGVREKIVKTFKGYANSIKNTATKKT